MANITLRSAKGSPLTNNEIDENISLLEKRNNGYLTKVLSSNYTFTADECDNYFIDLTGTIAASYTVTLQNTLKKEWSFRNSTTGGFTIYVVVNGGANSVPLYPGYWTHVSSNGTEANSTKAFDLCYTQTRNPGTNDRSVANTIFVNTAISNAVSNAVAPLAPYDSPILTGTPLSTTPPLFDDTTKIATTEYVQDAIWSGHKIRIIDGGRKGGGAFGIIRNNQIFVSGEFSQYVGAGSVVNKFGFVHVPFQNPQQIPSGTTIIDAAIAGWSMYVWLSNGWCYSFGFNGYGQLGHNNTTQQYSLKRIEYFVTNNISIDKVYTPSHIWCDDETAYIHVFFRGTNGTLYGAGYNGNGELGIGNFTTSIMLPTPLLDISNVIHLSSGSPGGGHTIAVSSNNPKQVYTWGYNVLGQLGIPGNTSSQHTPAVRYTHASDITKVRAGADFYYNSTSWVGHGMTMFLAGGELWGTGHNGLGQLGIGTYGTNVTSFTKATGSQVWVDFDVSGGGYSSVMAIDNAGAVWGTGYGGYGHMGNGSANTNTFTISNITSGAVSLKTVTYSTYGITIVKKSDGYLYATGHNSSGSLARGTAAFANFNTSFEVMTGPMGYQASDYMIIFDTYRRFDNCVFMLTTDGSLLSVGRNMYGIMANRDAAIGYDSECFNYCELPK